MLQHDKVAKLGEELPMSVGVVLGHDLQHQSVERNDIRERDPRQDRHCRRHRHHPSQIRLEITLRIRDLCFQM
jgi:hypothetical protein